MATLSTADDNHNPEPVNVDQTSSMAATRNSDATTDNIDIATDNNENIVQTNNDNNDNKDNQSANIVKKQKPKIKLAKHGRSNGVSILSEWNIDNNKCHFYICSGSVVSFIGDAIVNAANEGCIGGGYVDHAIAKAGGKMLKQFRLQLPIISNKRNKRCLTGNAVITQSGIGSNDCSLKCKYVLHAVGPNYKVRSKHITVKQCNKLLYNAYAQCLLIGKEYKLNSIGFCLISAGIFRGKQSLKKVLKIACKSIRDNIYEGCKVYLIGYKKDEVTALKNAAKLVFGPPSIIYSKKISTRKKKKPIKDK